MNDSSNDDQSTLPKEDSPKEDSPKEDISKDGESSQMAKISKLPLPIAIKIVGKNRRKSLGDLTDKDIKENYMKKLRNIDIIYKIDEVSYEHDTPKNKTNTSIEIINNDIIKRKSIDETEKNFSLEYDKIPPAENDIPPKNHTIISIINKDSNDKDSNDKDSNDSNDDNTSIITYRNYFSYTYYLIKRGIIPNIITNNDY